MIDRVPVIIGPFRSGTSLVAAVVHRLGFPVAPLIVPPAPPAWRSDYEDPLLTAPLMRRLVPDVEFLRSYVARRRVSSNALGFGGRLSLKCAYLALHWPTVLAALDEPPFVIRTYRHEGDRQRSLDAHPALSRKDDELLRPAIERIPPDASIGCEWAQDNPASCATMLADHLGVEDHDAIRAAAALIGPPTGY